MPGFLDYSVRDFLRQAASDAPTPGGGGVAALVGALGIAMASMAGNFTVGRPKYAEHEAAVQEVLAKLQPLFQNLQDGLDADAAAFLQISQAYKLPKETDAEKNARKIAVEAALLEALRVPFMMVIYCEEAIALLPELARIANPNLLSDVMVAAIMLESAALAARVNILVNAKNSQHLEARDADVKSAAILEKIIKIVHEVRAIIAGRT